jgi:hypothetical protein
VYGDRSRSRRHRWRAALTGPRAEPLAEPARPARGLVTSFSSGEHHDHLAPFHLRHLLDLTDFLEIRAQTLQHAHADLLVSHFTAAETQRDLGLVALFQEAQRLRSLTL